MFGPLNRWFRDRCRGHDRVAAGLTTISILLMVLVPLLLLVFEAGREAEIVYHKAVEKSAPDESAKNESASEVVPADVAN